MSKLSCQAFALASFLLVALGVHQAAAEISIPEPRVHSYVTPDGATYFAVSLTPNVAVASGAARDVVVLFDTSASQAGPFREKALAALDTLLTGLKAEDRVRLVAIDLEAVPLSPAFAAPQSDATKEAVAALKKRAPLGATDLSAALRAAVEQFDPQGSAPRSLIYIGDGLSAANFIVIDQYRSLVDALVAARIPVTSFAVGPRLDGPLLASLANQTGGMLAVDDEAIDAKVTGAFLANAVHGGVLWPTEVAWPKSFDVVYPQRVPPLRTDRDTIVLGQAAGALKGDLEITLTAQSAGEPTKLSWTLAAGESNPDYAFLPVLFESARSDAGLRLITVGTPGLAEAHRLLDQDTELLAKLARQAMASGNLASAERLADEALRRDPQDELSQSVKAQLIKLQSAPPATKPAASKSAAVETKTKAITDEPQEKLEVRRFSSEQAAPPQDLVLRRPTTNLPAPADVATDLEDPNEGEGRLLADIEQHNRLITDLVRTQVDNELREARARMASDPVAVEQSLKLMLERVVQTAELRAEVRIQLRRQLEAALRESRARAATKDILDQQREEAIAGAEERLRVLDALQRDQDKLRQLMDRFNSLMDEGRYVAADEIGEVEVAKIAPNTPIAWSSALTAHATGARMSDLALRLARQKAVVDTLGTVEMALMPFPDDQPVIYPDAAEFQELTFRRKKYASTDLKKVGPTEKKIRDELEKPTKMDFIEMPLQEALDYLKDQHSIEIQLDAKNVEDAGIAPDTPVTRQVNGITLKSALRLMLGEFELTYMIKGEYLLITTKDIANSPDSLVTKAYPVEDLVIPVQSMGGGMGGGMMGGGMMGGGMGGGGMGGGMGGMGGGMGGMGGGMGGMGGGMGGGMFNVAEDLKLGPAAKTAPAPKQPSAKQLAPKSPASKAAPAKAAVVKPTAKAAAGTKSAAAKAPVAKASPAAAGAKVPTVPGIVLPVPAGADPELVWHDYFTQHADVTEEAIRQTSRDLWNAKKYAELTGMLQAALRSGVAQSWMYEVMSLAMRAGGSSQKDVERALMSAVDFGRSADELLYVAQYMARIGLEARALQVFHQVAIVEPLRPEPYLYGLQLAEQLRDLEGLRWASLGVLKQAWPQSKAAFVQKASRVAAATVAELRSENRTAEADQLQSEIDKAKVRDCIVKVIWTGDADVDIMVEDPSGAICSLRNPRTSGGGVYIGDTSSPQALKAGEGVSETYTCPEAFNGTYRVVVRRVWGKVTTGKVTVEVCVHAGTPQEKRIRHQIPLGDQDAMVVFDLHEGRRTEALDEQQLVNAASGQLAVNQAMLMQQVNEEAGSQNGASGALSSARRNQVPVPAFNQAVGYQPVIISLPSGTQLFMSGVVAADRRYVRVTPLPNFSGVTSVTTYNTITGSAGTQTGAGGGTTSSGQIGNNPSSGGGTF